MAEFKGTYEDLQSKLTVLGCVGTWTEVSNGKQFKSSDGGILNWFPATGKINFQGSASARTKLESLFNGTQSQPSPASARHPVPAGKPKEKVFVVHGHDSVSREQLELVLHKLGLDPFVLANTSGGGLTIIEAPESEIGGHPDAARFGIVLMTPDDVGYSKRDGDSKAEPRARQNVVLEMGMLISTLGRSNVAILKKGHLEVPSDADGILYIGFNDHVKETVPRLAERLNHAGFTINAQAIAKAAA
ncbi:TIR domain-containing protein [Ralstonia solanacearum]|uniref:Nucleotide-binding protein n=1 Tax=Ralstonia solanacearum TaxID=305 RepID=A0AAE3T5Y8_RALSL|nr:TIR domain-containing protein [Ralstonia solanacearum]MBB6580634.1 nucleotide-binding protein [Ralstonia solanacearum]MDB0524022.1 nucleotide-binding protein [Ralstonia solanacearum]